MTIGIGLDDEASMEIIRLFNEPAGVSRLVDQGVKPDLIEQLPLLGISGVGNMLSAIKMAKYYETDSNEVIMAVGTDSMEMYGSRLVELNEERGEFTNVNAAATMARHLHGAGIDSGRALPEHLIVVVVEEAPGD